VTLPQLKGHTQIMEVVDHFSEMTHFIALNETVTTKDIEQAFLKEV
jgi:hypothetical protein